MGCLEDEEGLVWEGPELLDFSVDDVAEQLTLMDVVSIRAGPLVQGLGWGRVAGGGGWRS